MSFRFPTRRRGYGPQSGAYTHEVPVEIAGKEVTATLTFSFQRGYPATGPTYSCGGEPGEPDGVEDVECVAIRDDAGALLTPPLWLREYIVDSVSEGELLEEVYDRDEYARERAAEDRAEWAREDRDSVYDGFAGRED